ncbi:hypothetical protein FQZ97_1123970 [compost metagenome]
MREKIKPSRGIWNANPFHKPDRFKTRSIALQSAMESQRLDNLWPNFLDRIERGTWVLKNHRNATAANAFLHATWCINELLTINDH